ncbi:hypothetical protein C8F01DRAFT_1076122 [Mycena amicta]|nr:hypothetical protein C8F01DRAFT_1076122 [Mycena amicta]
MYNLVLDSSLRRPSFGIEKDNFVEMAWQVQPIGVHLNLKGNKQFGGNFFIEDILKSAKSNLAECTLLFDNFLSCATYLIASPTQGKTVKDNFHRCNLLGDMFETVVIVTTSNMHCEMLQLSFSQVQVALYKVAFNKAEDALMKADS